MCVLWWVGDIYCSRACECGVERGGLILSSIPLISPSILPPHITLSTLLISPSHLICMDIYVVVCRYVWVYTVRMHVCWGGGNI